MRNPAELASQTGYEFSHEAHLIEALTHSSARTAKFRKGGKIVHENERLEFLGDRVLGLSIAEWLMELYPDFTEGELATRLNAMVRKEACARVAHNIGLEMFVHVGKGERSRGVNKLVTVLSDAMEALIAAVYLDGGFEAARTMIRRLWHDQMAGIGELKRDAKTALQEWAQGKGLLAPVYTLVSRSGLDHRPEFEVEVFVEGFDKTIGFGSTKRAAEQDGAKNMLRAESIPV